MENNYIYPYPVPYIFNKSHNEVIENIYSIFSLFGISPINVKNVIYFMIKENYPFYHFKGFIETYGLMFMELIDMFPFLL